MRSLMAVLGLCLLGGSVAADTPIFRCIDSDGGITFSQTACGSHAVLLEHRRLQAIGDGLRPAEKAWLEKRSERLRDASIGAPEEPPGSNTGASAASASQRQAYRCRRTRQQLDALNAERRRGYPAGKGIELHERQQRYETYLDSFCS